VIGFRPRRSWRHASYAVVDFETTGLDLEADHVLSYGVIPVEEGRIRLSGALYGIVRPPRPVPPASIRVHGIRPVELESAPELEDVADEILEALESRLVVAYASKIELAFLRRLHDRPVLRRSRHAIDVIDLAVEVATREWGEAPPSPRLSDLAEGYGVPVGRTHHAFADALITAQLFLVLATRLERLGVTGVRGLVRAGRSRKAGAVLASTLGC
jgi:DNA polymerase III subunit epsilon